MHCLYNDLNRSRAGIVFFYLATKERECDIKGPLCYVDANHIKERHTVFVCLVGAVEEEEFRVRSKVGKRVRMCKEDCYNSAI